MSTPELKVVSPLSRSPLFGRRQIVQIPTSWIEGWENNPPLRTEERNLDELAVRLREEIGQLVPVSVVSIGKVDGHQLFRLVDGHRRHVILKVNGVDYIEAILYLDVVGGSQAFGQLFEALNTATRAIGIRERIWLALAGEEAAAGPDAVKLANEVKGAISTEALRKFKEHVCPVQAFRNAKSAFVILEDKQLESGDRANRRRFISACMLWQFKHNEQQSLKLLVTAYNQMNNKDARSKGKKLLQALEGAIAADTGLPGNLRGKGEDEDDEDEDESTMEKIVVMPSEPSVQVRRNGQIVRGV
jgi:hypothetical protein